MAKAKYAIVMLNAKTIRFEVLFSGTKGDLERQIEELRAANCVGGLTEYPEGSTITLQKWTHKSGESFPNMEHRISLARFQVVHKRTRQSQTFQRVVVALVDTRNGLEAWTTKFVDCIARKGFGEAVASYAGVVLRAQIEHNLLGRYIDDLHHFSGVVDAEVNGVPVNNLPDEMEMLACGLRSIIRILTKDLLCAGDLATQHGSAVEGVTRQMCLVAKASILTDMNQHLSSLTQHL